MQHYATDVEFSFLMWKRFFLCGKAKCLASVEIHYINLIPLRLYYFSIVIWNKLSRITVVYCFLLKSLFMHLLLYYTDLWQGIVFAQLALGWESSISIAFTAFQAWIFPLSPIVQR